MYDTLLVLGNACLRRMFWPVDKNNISSCQTVLTFTDLKIQFFKQNKHTDTDITNSNTYKNRLTSSINRIVE